MKAPRNQYLLNNGISVRLALCALGANELEESQHKACIRLTWHALPFLKFHLFFKDIGEVRLPQTL